MKQVITIIYFAYASCQIIIENEMELNMRVLISDFSNIVYTSQKVVQLKNKKLMNNIL